MGINEFLSTLRSYASEDKNVPIKVENNESLFQIVSLIANNSNSTIRIFIKFDPEEKQNLFFETLISKEIQKNLREFLNEESSKIVLLTNDKNKVKKSGFLENISTTKFKILNFPPKVLKKLEEHRKLLSFLVGDEKSILIGSFDFDEEDAKPTFANFNDKKFGKAIVTFHSQTVDQILSHGELKK